MGNPSTWKTLSHYGIAIALALGVAFSTRSFIIEAYQISGSTMSPTLLPGDTIFVAKWPLWLQNKLFPQRGDIVVYSIKKENELKPLDLIKRVIGLPGDEIALKEGDLFLNQKKVNVSSQNPCAEKKAPSHATDEVCKPIPLKNFGPQKIPENSLFVIGDLGSKWGIIPVSSLKGKAFYTWLSIGKTQSFDSSASRLPKFRFERMFRRIQ